MKSTVVTVKLLVAYTLKLKFFTKLVKTRFKDKAGWLGFTFIGYTLGIFYLSKVISRFTSDLIIYHPKYFFDIGVLVYTLSTMTL